MKIFIVLAILLLPASALAQICGPITVWGANPGDTVSFRWTLDRAPNNGAEQILSDGGQPQFTLLSGSCGSCNMSFQTSIANPSIWTIGPRRARCHFDNVTFTPNSNFNQSSWPVDEEGKAVMRQAAADWTETGKLAGSAATAWFLAGLPCGNCFAPFAAVFTTIGATAVWEISRYNDLALDPDDYDYCTPADFNRQSPDAMGLQYVGDPANDALVDETTAIDAYLDQAYRSANKMNTAARDGSGCFSDRQNDTINAIYGAGVEIQNYGYWAGVAADEINNQVGDNYYADWLRDLQSQLYAQGDGLKQR